MEVEILAASLTDNGSLQADLVDVYRRAFRGSPYAKSPAEVDAFARFLPVHAGAPGYRLVVATDSDEGKVVGFSYGRTAARGQPWYDLVEGSLQSAGLGEWLIDAYQIVEMAVAPAVQRRGIGSRLHERLLSGLPHRRAVLTTMAADTPAYRFYWSKGWRVLVEKIMVPQLPRPYRLMGVGLPLAQAGNRPKAATV